ncbi:MAG: hypothetical protein IT363_08165 [Methanoregulaceae archaeon]|nr:hypothetical protein [Methanoregulaceae archaeon]
MIALLPLFPQADDAAMIALRQRFASSTWSTTIQLEDRNEHVIKRYTAMPDGSLRGRGTVIDFGKVTPAVQTRFSWDRATKKVLMDDQHGTMRLTGEVQAEGNKLVFLYRPAGSSMDYIRDELTFNAQSIGEGKVTVGGKTIATYTMRRVAEPPKILALRGLDPVELAKGKEVEGVPNWTHTAGVYTYRFSSDANLEEFRAKTAQYEIQFGGACGSMGPLSGRGAPDRFMVHKGRIYLFASDGCRSRFAASPDAFIDKAEPALRPNGRARTTGRNLLELAATAHGGLALDAIKSIAYTEISKFESEGKQRPFDQMWMATTRGEYAHFSTWNDVFFATVAGPQGNWSGRMDQPEPMSNPVRAYFVREFVKNPTWILRHRTRYIPEYRGKSKRPGTGAEADLVSVHWQGATIDLWIDPTSRRIVGWRNLELRSTGFRPVSKAITSFVEVKGVTVPKTWTTQVEGGQPTPKAITSFYINEMVEPGYFVNPLNVR